MHARTLGDEVAFEDVIAVDLVGDPRRDWGLPAETFGQEGAQDGEVRRVGDFGHAGVADDGVEFGLDFGEPGRVLDGGADEGLHGG